MELKWPWNEFPVSKEAWEVCLVQFEKALFLLMETNLGLGVQEKIREFLVEVTKKTEPKITITLEEFRSLPFTSEGVDRKVGGRIALGKEDIRERMIKDFENGLSDIVFFLEVKRPPEVLMGVPEVVLEVTMAKLVE